MTQIIVLVVLVFGLQIGLFIWGRKIRKRDKENSVLERYGIKSRADAWRTLSKPDLPENDRKELERLYNQE